MEITKKLLCVRRALCPHAPLFGSDFLICRYTLYQHCVASRTIM